MSWAVWRYTLSYFNCWFLCYIVKVIVSREVIDGYILEHIILLCLFGYNPFDLLSVIVIFTLYIVLHFRDYLLFLFYDPGLESWFFVFFGCFFFALKTVLYEWLLGIINLDKLNCSCCCWCTVLYIRPLLHYFDNQFRQCIFCVWGWINTRFREHLYLGLIY